MKVKVIFESDDFWVVDKPAGMVVNRAQTVKRKTLQDWAEKRLRDQGIDLTGESDFNRRGGIVHRLDKATSGLLVAAKNEIAFTRLQVQFKARTVEKKYLALVHGRVVPSKGEIRFPVGRNPFNREKFGVFPGGREALTGYEAADYFSRSGKEFSLVEAFPKTGRTHQIRVHFKALGHPIVADAKYAGRKTNRRDREWCPRMFLHAAFLAFDHPQSGKRARFKSPLPDDLAQALESLEKREASE